MCVCVCVCVHIYLYKFIYMFFHHLFFTKYHFFILKKRKRNLNTYTYIHTYVHIYACIYIYIYIYIHIYTKTKCEIESGEILMNISCYQVLYSSKLSHSINLTWLFILLLTCQLLLIYFIPKSLKDFYFLIINNTKIYRYHHFYQISTSLHQTDLFDP